jgi:hypothetical protein
MQTLLDLIIKDLIIKVTTYRTIVVFVIFLICNVAPIDYWMAVGLTVLIKLFHVFLFVDIFIIIIRTYAEEENCEAIFRRSGSEFIILRMHL